jgi:hypothetical protein
LAWQKAKSPKEAAMIFRGLALAGVAALLLSAPASAHHSYAMFDHDQTLKVTGTVKSFEWTNPHSWLNVVVTEPAGKSYPFGFETRSPSNLASLGMNPQSMKPGDKVTVSYHPLKDGSHGGEITMLLLADGKVINYGKSLEANPHY